MTQQPPNDEPELPWQVDVGIFGVVMGLTGFAGMFLSKLPAPDPTGAVYGFFPGALFALAISVSVRFVLAVYRSLKPAAPNKTRLPLPPDDPAPDLRLSDRTPLIQPGRPEEQLP